MKTQDYKTFARIIRKANIYALSEIKSGNDPNKLTTKTLDKLISIMLEEVGLDNPTHDMDRFKKLFTDK